MSSLARDAAMNNKKHFLLKVKVYFLFTILLIMLVASFIASILYGPVGIDPFAIVGDMLRGDVLTDTEKAIIYSIRMPIAIAAIASGALLGISGLLYQILLRNPMGDPYVMGVASISYTALVAVAFLAVLIGAFFPYVSFIAPLAVLTIALIYTGILSILSYRLSMLQILLVGVSLSFAFSGISILLLSRLPPEIAGYLAVALMGNFESSGRQGSLILVTSLVIITVPAYLLAIRYLDPLLLGEEYARSLGVNTGLVRLIIGLIAGSSAAITVTYVGIVGFIGFASPHIARLLVKSNKSSVILPLSCLVGGLLAILTNLFIRIAFQGSTVPVTAVTSLFGAPLLIYMVSRMRGEYAWA